MSLLHDVAPGCVLVLALALSPTPRHPAEEIAGLHPGADSCTKALAEAGNVRFDFYAQPGHTSYGGTTDFHLDFTFSFTYRYTTRGDGDGAWVTIYPDVRARPVLSHIVHLPRGMSDATPWYRRLRRHEYDHVAVSTDERPRLLFQYLASNVRTIVRRAGKGASVSPGWVRDQVQGELQMRNTAVVRVVQANYELLDRLTAHGVVPLDDRPAFFDSLYTRANLKDAGFPWLEDVAGVITQPRYRNALRPRCD